jgi:peptidyl-lysine (3S)-dioxygenase / protease
MLLERLERIDGCSIKDFENRSISGEKPIVIARLEHSGPSESGYTMSDISRRFGRVRVPVRDSDDEFKEFFGRTNNEVTPRKTMRLADYISLVEQAAVTGTRPPYAGNVSIRNDPLVAKKLDALLLDCRFPEWLPDNTNYEHRLWIGAAGQRSTIHNDPYHNFNAQIVGRKRFIVFPPNEHDSIYPIFFHPGMWASPIEPHTPDLKKYPKFAAAKGFECELNAGEILYLPRFWWHHVEALTVSVSVNRWILPEGDPKQWWHQQPNAQRYISYEQLIERISQRFELLPDALKEFERGEFLKLKAELQNLTSISESRAY